MGARSSRNRVRGTAGRKGELQQRETGLAQRRRAFYCGTLRTSRLAFLLTQSQFPLTLFQFPQLSLFTWI